MIDILLCQIPSRYPATHREKRCLPRCVSIEMKDSCRYGVLYMDNMGNVYCTNFEATGRPSKIWFALAIAFGSATVARRAVGHTDTCSALLGTLGTSVRILEMHWEEE